MQSGGWAIYIVVGCRVHLGECRYIIFFPYAELNIVVLYSYLVFS